jgi:hypothetical protein
VAFIFYRTASALCCHNSSLLSDYLRASAFVNWLKIFIFAGKIADMRLAVMLVLTIFTVSQNLFAQELKTADAMVTFDPLFWKENLKLSAEQYDAIQRINREYYERIYLLADEHEGNIAYLQHQTAELLQTRSEKIWNTFRPHQKRKWEKLASAYSNESGTAYSRLPVHHRSYN